MSDLLDDLFAFIPTGGRMSLADRVKVMDLLAEVNQFRASQPSAAFAGGAEYQWAARRIDDPSFLVEASSYLGARSVIAGKIIPDEWQIVRRPVRFGSWKVVE